ncbi:hypothetical protein ACFLV3_05345 [Chloroflexota bacterium]
MEPTEPAAEPAEPTEPAVTPAVTPTPSAPVPAEPAPSPLISWWLVGVIIASCSIAIGISVWRFAYRKKA